MDVNASIHIYTHTKMQVHVYSYTQTQKLICKVVASEALFPTSENKYLGNPFYSNKSNLYNQTKICYSWKQTKFANLHLKS